MDAYISPPLMYVALGQKKTQARRRDGGIRLCGKTGGAEDYEKTAQSSEAWIAWANCQMIISKF